MENTDMFPFDDQTVENQGFAQEQPTEQVEVPQFTEQEFQQEEPAAGRVKKHGKGGKIVKTIVCVLLVLALVVGSCYGTAMYMDQLWEAKTQKYYDSVNGAMANILSGNNAENAPTTPSVSVPSQGGMTPAQVYAANVNAVVAISNQGITTNIFGQVSETASSGTGFII